MNAISEPPPKLTIRRLLMSTAAIAFGCCAATVEPFPLLLRLLGLAAGFYGFATVVFAFSTSLNSPWRELLFLVGLPAYLGCVICGTASCFVFIATLFQLAVPQTSG